MARRRSNRVFRVAAGVLGAAALAVTAMTPQTSAQASAAAPSPAGQTRTLPAGQGGSAPTGQADRARAAETSAPMAAQSSKALAGQTGMARAAAAGCGTTLDVVAHEDDDLLFINPSVSDDIAAGRCVVTLFVTAGDSGRPSSYWLRREQGSMAAYTEMARDPGTWLADTIVLGGHPISRRRLTGTGITLLFLRLPDSHGSATRPYGTLQALWQGQVAGLRPLGGGAAYTRAALLRTLTAAMDTYRPDRIRTLDYAGTYGDGDHADHHTVGYLTFAAQRSYRARHRISGYRGYTVADYPGNLTAQATDQKLSYFLAYAPFDSKVCQSAEDCLTNFYGPRFTHSLTTASSSR